MSSPPSMLKYNLHALQLTHFICTIWVYGSNVKSCVHCKGQDRKPFHCPKMILMLLCSQFFQLLAMTATKLHFSTMVLLFLEFQNEMIQSSFALDFFHFACFWDSAMLGCVIFIPFYCSLFHSVNISQFIHLPVDRYLGFLFAAILNILLIFMYTFLSGFWIFDFLAILLIYN